MKLALDMVASGEGAKSLGARETIRRVRDAVAFD
jgi:hypothetical protein